MTKVTGGSLFSMLLNGWKMKQSNGMTFAQTLMAANAPLLIQEAMVKGHPSQGILPSGQIAGAIKDLPKVADLIDSIVIEAEATLQRFQGASAAINTTTKHTVEI
jgi:NAD(P)H-dependent flavin oxidoreductase YrpB (nitropropane dioxygenase family)